MGLSRNLTRQVQNSAQATPRCGEAFYMGSRKEKSSACLGVCRGILHLTMLYRVGAPSVSDAALSAASRGGGLGALIGCATLRQALCHQGEVFSGDVQIVDSL